ncbi:hypothetical protein ECG_00217 [Echinococcus granulosus]|uniref:Expressed protein n=1 Tax=Echinococcus granulosus TaxID=6210 RepID=A0A068WS43_ECHGR|nr:hypothetical protein ECG_00217 [Echinococcus granulosus]CDS22631.1 expressed protein [Echinococcus granulosus]
MNDLEASDSFYQSLPDFKSLPDKPGRRNAGAQATACQGSNSNTIGMHKVHVHPLYYTLPLLPSFCLSPCRYRDDEKLTSQQTPSSLFPSAHTHKPNRVEFPSTFCQLSLSVSSKLTALTFK